MNDINEAQKAQLNSFLKGLADVLDLSPTQIREAKERYEAVGDWLGRHDSDLRPFKPVIYPQGSFRLGTMIQPLTDEENYDIDLVCNLEKPPIPLTQEFLKEMIGNRLKANGTHSKMLDPFNGGKRCWTLKYADETRFHLDILPAIPDPYKYLFESLNVPETQFTEAIRITSKDYPGYNSSSDISTFPKSNPKGYSEWFKSRVEQFELLYESTRLQAQVEKLDDWEVKTPLHRAIQILKRHRDIKFQDDQDNKPISIIITTLAAHAYNQEDNIQDALSGILRKMDKFIGERFSLKHGRMVKWIPNPVNPEENFADKWPDNPVLQHNFYLWLESARKDFNSLIPQTGIHKLKPLMENMFGKDVATKTFAAVGVASHEQIKAGNLKYDKSSGTIGKSGDEIKKHNFHGLQ